MSSVPARLTLRLLGPMALARDGTERALTRSRKTRALLAYLALASAPIPRSRLCDLFWDAPRDPRGELRWSLSRLRLLVDSPDSRRLATGRDLVELDRGDAFVDAVEIADAADRDLRALDVARQQELLGLFRGEFLEGLELEQAPAFDAWLTAQRRRFRGCRLALLEQLARNAPEHEVDRYIEQWLALAPFDLKAHEVALTRFARRRELGEGERHLRSVVRALEDEGLDAAGLLAYWDAIRLPARASPPTPVERPGSPRGAGASHAHSTRRASIAVLPFDGGARDGARDVIGDAFARDVIMQLAKLRCLFVIGQGTVFALRERELAPEEIGRMLNVDYVASGSLHRFGARVTIAVELIETRTARVVWAERFEQRVDDTFRVLQETGKRIVAEIAGQVELVERNRALLKPPSSLDAWESHHRGLWHAYRFTRQDNDRAHRFFSNAASLDPTFSRAYAGLSFTHFQAAFQNWGERRAEMELAFESASQSLFADDRDPAAHWAMGRALWLHGQQRESLVELEQAVRLSPNFAVGHYMLAFVHAQSGDPQAAIDASDLSRSLSPFDPLLFGMLGSRALALVRLERFEEAADYAVKAAARPNAHAHILAIAGLSLALAGAVEDGRRHIAAIHRRLPRYGMNEFLSAFRFEPSTERRFRAGARLLRMG